LTEELLDRLLIPKACFPVLLTCRTFDDLSEADVPAMVRDRLFDCITEPNFDRVLSQPSFVTGSTDDLLRFKQGDLLGFLLKLNSEQEKYVTWALNATGATLLKGSPGTGKSTVALYRTREILRQLQTTGIDRPASCSPPTPTPSSAFQNNCCNSFWAKMRNLSRSKRQMRSCDRLPPAQLENFSLLRRVICSS
jgi:hypothetical protein